MAHSKRNTQISISDNFEFDKEIDVLRLFGYCYKAYRRATKNLNEQSFVWFPRLAIKTDNGEIVKQSKNWINLISDDRETIYEKYTSEDEVTIEQRYSERDQGGHRIVFAKSKNYLNRYCYRFIGIYKFDKFEDGWAVHKRIGKSISVGDKIT